ncbi:Spermidine synthase [Caldithrix abyssi DSM 13497]|uniref:S-adenosylmethionine decarboxylase proenzyme n=1 Tax=Caldithrix abyssi DSM 13497 TaxID=880073 RepID=H1XQY3_CALAY|nr:polyamine aminopropyltransferase [Caldithrix abyssi]APF19991.1 spermidine synthase [Caldithrix abyssi DSM 13497]EHO40077.1 Spermidine synthase [Caldithrix abyssi DSM 13497]
MNALGQHILVEFVGCDPNVLNEVTTIEQGMLAAADRANATIINSTFHYFSPYGVSGVVVIQESHLAVHTWPEYRYAAVDLFTCGDEVDPWKAFDYLKDVFKAQNYSALETRRGSLNLLTRIDFEPAELREQFKKYMKEGRIERNVWLTDKDENIALSLRHTGEVLYDERTPYQHVKVLNTYAFGKTLTLDNMIMCTEKDEFHYHEMMSHPLMMAHGNVKNVLVIGGGDGGVVREVLRHDGVEKVTMVEIDGKVVEAARLHLPQIAVAFDDPRLDLRIEDGIKFVADAPAGTYDLIVVDSTDPIGPAEGLFSETFYRNCHRILNDNGAMIVQGEAPRFNEQVFLDIHQTLKNIFGPKNAHIMLFHVPTYPTGVWSGQIGVKGSFNPAEFDEVKASEFCRAHQLKYYSPEIHKASFVLPPYVKEMIGR